MVELQLKKKLFFQVKEKEALDAVIKSGSASTKSTDGDDANDHSKLTLALKTITDEKTRLESMFTEDKKKCLSKIKALEGAKTSLEADRSAIKADLDEMKAKWMVERHQRDKEADDYALQLRELQKVLAEERASKEGLEMSLQQSTASQSGMVPSHSVVSKAAFDDVLKRADTLEAEGRAKDEKIKADTSKHTTEVAALKLEIATMKEGHSAAVERAEGRAQRAEVMGAGIRSEQETRVINLEARLQELSEAVGTYDRLRQQDQSSISKLKERVHQLETEKTELERSSEPSSSGDEDSNLDVQSLMDRILRLKTLLKDANRRSENPVQLDDFLCDESSGKWKEMFMRLKVHLSYFVNFFGFSLAHYCNFCANCQGLLSFSEMVLTSTNGKQCS